MGADGCLSTHIYVDNTVNDTVTVTLTITCRILVSAYNMESTTDDRLYLILTLTHTNHI